MNNELKVWEPVYKIDSKGKLRFWQIESYGDCYRAVSGLVGGTAVNSGWIYPTPKNVGRTNQTLIEEQTEKEILALYTKKKEQGRYRVSIEEATKQESSFPVCMLAATYNAKKHTAYPYYSQPKLDGIRCLISKNGMTSRRGKPIVSCPHIMEALKAFFEIYPYAILDGELYNHELKEDFEELSSLIGVKKPTEDDLAESKKIIQYHIYDCIIPAGFDVRTQFLTDSFLPIDEVYGYIFRVPTIIVNNEDEAKDALLDYLDDGYEGQMLRVPESPYEGKRSKYLIKWKATADFVPFEDDEFEILEIKEGKGNWAGRAKSIKIYLGDGQTQSVGVAGPYELLEKLLKDASSYSWCTVQFQKRTKKNKLRFPVATKFYKQKREM